MWSPGTISIPKIVLVTLVSLLILFTVFIAGCTQRENDITPSTVTTSLPVVKQVAEETPSPPDLSIASIDIFPAMPHAGERFTGVVYVRNTGGTSSGQYDVAMYIKDVARTNVYPIGTFRQQPMKPNEQYVVWQSQQLIVNDPGSFQLWVEIKPFNFKDGNDQNNIKGQSFNAV